jgi:hypothetical protein
VMVSSKPVTVRWIWWRYFWEKRSVDHFMISIVFTSKNWNWLSEQIGNAESTRPAQVRTQLTCSSPIPPISTGL